MPDRPTLENRPIVAPRRGDHLSSTKTYRSNCQFLVQQTQDHKVVVVVQLLHETIPALRNAVVGFDLLGGIRVEQATQLVNLLNEYVLNVFVTVTEKGAQV